MVEFKNYRLLKDLPFAKAGEIFESRILDDGKEYLFWGEITIKEMKNFDEWFEEIPEPKWAYYMNQTGIGQVRVGSLPSYEHDLKERGNYFETEEEINKRIKFLKAEATIKQDTKGFTPDWEDFEQDKFYASWDFYHNRPVIGHIRKVKQPTIYFKTVKDLEESILNNPASWKTYLTYNH